MFGKRSLKSFLLSRESQRGQSLILIALAAIGLLALGAFAADGSKLWDTRRERQPLSDQACLSGAIASTYNGSTQNAIINSLEENNVDLSLAGVTDNGDGTYTFNNVGSGESLTKGIETSPFIRVALWGFSSNWLASFAGWEDGTEMGARAKCEAGLGGPEPLSLKEFEDGSKILETSDPNDTWNGMCPDQSIDPESDPATRDPANCWVWGDWQVLAGDGHVPNEGQNVSMSGLIAPDVRCNGAPGEANKCTDKTWIPPVEPAQVNTLKSLTMDYICQGYDGRMPIAGVFDGVHGANVAVMDGVSNNQLASEIDSCYDVGDRLIVFVYGAGEAHDADKNFDYVEVIGLAVVEIVYIDANTVAVVPVYPAVNAGDETTLRDDLPKTLEELEAEGFNSHPNLLMWEN